MCVSTTSMGMFLWWWWLLLLLLVLCASTGTLNVSSSYKIPHHYTKEEQYNIACVLFFQSAYIFVCVENIFRRPEI